MSEIEAIKICNTIGFATSFSNPQGMPLNTTKEELAEAMRMAIQEDVLLQLINYHHGFIILVLNKKILIFIKRIQLY